MIYIGRIRRLCFVRDIIRLKLVLLWLKVLNFSKSTSALGDTPVVVSLTTHGHRIERVWYTLESIARGQIRPIRIIVWLDRSLEDMPLPPELSRLQDRGVEIRFVRDIGPHQKYYYALDEALSVGMSLATVDDDIIYWSWWLKELIAAQSETPDAIVCYRGRQFTFSDNGQPAPYVDWPLFSGHEAKPTLFFTGVSGVLYPNVFLEELRMHGMGFKQVCPRADDIWLNYIAARAGIVARQVFTEPFGFPEIPNTQDIALWTENADGGNDVQISATYDIATLQRIR